MGWMLWSGWLVGSAEAPLDAGGASAEERFDAAAREYATGRYAEAAAIYEQLIREGWGSESVWRNRGHAWLQAGRPGRAVASYRRALEWAPRDTGLRRDLAAARARVRWVGESPSASGGWGEWVGWLRAGEWAALGLVGLTVWGLWLLVGEVRPGSRGRGWWTGLVAGGLTLMSGAGWVGWILVEKQAPGVVITEEAAVRYGPLEEAQTAFQIPEGAEVRILDAKGEWVNVRDPLGRTGWLLRNRLEMWR